jgi:trimeric autotransporter adhesin
MIAVGVIAAAGTGIGLGVSVATAQGPASFRTAVASVSSVSHTLDVSGVLQPVTDATAGFQISGTVASVDVIKGQKVTAGETIATLDTASVQATLTEAQDTLNSAEAKLTEDELDESSSSSGGSSATQTGSVQAATTAATTGSVSAASYVLTSASTPSGTASSESGSSSSSVTQDQQAVVTDQHQVDTDLQSAAADLAAMQTACTSGGGNPPTRSTTTSTTIPSSNTTSTTIPSSNTTSTTIPSSNTTSTIIPSSSTTSTTVPASSSTSACAAALTAASTAEEQVSADQKTLATDETNLAGALSTEAKSTGTTKTSPSPSSTGSSNTGGSSTPRTSSSATGATGSSTSTVNTDTPEQLASDEATIDNDKATLVNAQQSLAAATLVSPVSGTVESVGLMVGDSVSAGSTSNAITVVDWNSYEVTATLTTNQVQDVKVGQPAQVTVDGTSGTLQAKVTRVGPVEESGSSYTYPVIVTVTSSTGQLAAGSAAQTVIDLSQANDTVVVPTSAVHTTSTGSYVYLDKAGKEVRQTVKMGLVGDVYSQITSGLTQGQVVVLADPSESVPSSSTNSTSNRFGGTGTFRVGTFTGGGTTGPGGSGAPPAAGSSRG